MRRNPGESPGQKFYRTSKLTAVPARTFCPAAGACDTTMLAGVGCAGGVGVGAVCGALGLVLSLGIVVGAGGATLTLPSRNPSSCSARLTVPKGCPMKLGITNAGGAAVVVTSKLIFGASTCAAFAVGLCAKT